MVPPFVYNFQCGSAILVAYIPVYIYTYCLRIALQYVYFLWIDRVQYADVPLWLRCFIWPNVRWPEHWSRAATPSVTPPPPPNHASSSTIEGTGRLTEESSAGTIFDASTHMIIDPHKIVAVALHDVALLLTYGLCSPVLAFAIVLGAALSLGLRRIFIGRFLYLRTSYLLSSSAERREEWTVAAAGAGAEVSSPLGRLSFLPQHLQHSEYREASFSGPQERQGRDFAVTALESALQVTRGYFRVCVWPVVVMSAVFFAGVCFDMAGDESGWESALWLPICAFSLPVVILIGTKLQAFCPTTGGEVAKKSPQDATAVWREGAPLSDDYM
jgi:hypothetical protein